MLWHYFTSISKPLKSDSNELIGHWFIHKNWQKSILIHYVSNSHVKYYYYSSKLKLLLITIVIVFNSYSNKINLYVADCCIYNLRTQFIYPLMIKSQKGRRNYRMMISKTFFRSWVSYYEKYRITLSIHIAHELSTSQTIKIKINVLINKVVCILSYSSLILLLFCLPVSL